MELAFTGDTDIRIADIAENDDVFHAKLLIIECTFFDDTVDQAGARERGHMHIRDLAANADRFHVRRCSMC